MVHVPHAKQGAHTRKMTEQYHQYYDYNGVWKPMTADLRLSSTTHQILCTYVT